MRNSSVWLWAAIFAITVVLFPTPASQAPAQGVCAWPSCQANVQFFGHYPTRWRPWPGETRPDIHFPQAIRAEAIKRPKGERAPELPKEQLEPVIPQPGKAFPEPAPVEPFVPGIVPPTPEAPGEMNEGNAPADLPAVPPPGGGVPPAGPSPFQPEPATPAPQSGASPIPTPGAPAGASFPQNFPAYSAGLSPGVATTTLSPDFTVPHHAAQGTPFQPSPVPAMPLSSDTVVIPPASVTTLPSSSPPSRSIPEIVGSGPVVVTNPTVAQTPSPAPPGMAGINPPADKLAVQRVPSLPGVMRDVPAQSAPIPSEQKVFTAQIGAAQPSFVQSSPPVPPVAGPSVPPTSDIVWAEDTSSARNVSPANYLNSDLSRGSTINTAALLPPAETTAPRETTPALGGFCPVELLENETWMKGDARFAVEYRGRVYYCAGATQKRRFQTNPERYAPVLDGKDPVAFFDQGQNVEGKMEHCVVYDGRLYMFSGIQSLARFRQNPQRYAQRALRAAE